MKLVLMLACAALAVCGCVPTALLHSERRVHDAVAPEYLRYVDADPALSPEQKQSRRDTIEAWDMSLRSWEGQAAPAPAR